MRVGIFDSGRGGEAALRRLTELAPSVDAVLYCDRENAPYGTKTEEELIKLVSDDIDRLLSLGAEIILMACCTASAVYAHLSAERQRIAIPIIEPTSREALRVADGKPIGVICTSASAKMRAFESEIHRLSPKTEVYTLPCQRLVALAEAGVSDGNITPTAKAEIEGIREYFKDRGIGALILGCTHFSYFESTLEGAVGTRVINSAKIGARELVRQALQ